MNKGLKILLGIILGLAVVFGGFTIANRINERAMHEYIDTFATVEYENQLTPKYDENGVAYFTTDGDFKIMQLTDVHIGGGCLSTIEDKKAINAIAAMVTAEKPDLVIITGDMAATYPNSGTLNNRYTHEFVGHIMERLGVYWTVNFGNHDSEIYNFLNRAQVAEMYESENLEHCLFSSDDGGVYGECNHVINVKNSIGYITQSLIMMDSNAYTDEDPLGLQWKYDNIHEDQIEWYENVIQTNQAYNENLLGHVADIFLGGELPTVKSLLFIHIPLMETRIAYQEYLAAGGNTDDVTYHGGKIGEKDPYVYCSMIEEDMFETMLELDSTKAVFFGHDHLNYAVIEYKGITFSYGHALDYFAYADIDKIGAQRGCSIITCRADTSFVITHENYYQDKYQPLYEKEVVDLTN